MRDVTVSDFDQLQACADRRDVVLAMDEDTFRVFYEHTSRPLWGYLVRLSGNRTDADDLLQEAYYRILRAGIVFEDENHRRRYLYTVATNLVLDRRRRRLTRPEAPMPDCADDLRCEASDADRLEHRAIVRGAMSRLRPRDRALLWLAYAQGASHDEIGSVLGLKSASVRSMLFRARERFSAVIGGMHPRGGGRAEN
jgi:RNA polymerase sigma-70 factor (ECF subfamily)